MQYVSTVKFVKKNHEKYLPLILPHLTLQNEINYD